MKAESLLFDWHLTNPDATIEEAYIQLRILGIIKPETKVTDYSNAPNHSLKPNPIIDILRQKRSVSLECNGIVKEFDSLSGAARFLGVSPSSMSTRAKNNWRIRKRHTKEMWRISYLEKNVL